MLLLNASAFPTIGRNVPQVIGMTVFGSVLPLFSTLIFTFKSSLVFRRVSSERTVGPLSDAHQCARKIRNTVQLGVPRMSRLKEW